MKYASHYMSTWITAVLTVLTISLLAPTDAKPLFNVPLHSVLPTALSVDLP